MTMVLEANCETRVNYDRFAQQFSAGAVQQDTPAIDIKKEVKENSDDSDEESADVINVLEEESDIITVNAADLKSDDERMFLEQMEQKVIYENIYKKFMLCDSATENQLKNGLCCPKCNVNFNAQMSYTQHVICNACDKNKNVCTFCPMQFNSDVELNSHLSQHAQNRFFCNEYCGKYFKTLEKCQEHEFLKHKKGCICCNICKSPFEKPEALLRHKDQVHHCARIHACSICRDWFLTERGLMSHWMYKKACGHLMQASALCGLAENKAPITTSTKQHVKRTTESLPAEIVIKRIKVEEVEEFVSNNLEENEFLPNSPASPNKVQIKEEPIETNDTDMINEAICNENIPMLSHLVPEVQIKTEFDDDDTIQIKDEPYDYEEFIEYIPQESIKAISKDPLIMQIAPNATHKSPINLTPNFTLQTIEKSTFNSENHCNIENEFSILTPKAQNITARPPSTLKVVPINVLQDQTKQHKIQATTTKNAKLPMVQLPTKKKNQFDPMIKPGMSLLKPKYGPNKGAKISPKKFSFKNIPIECLRLPTIKKERVNDNSTEAENLKSANYMPMPVNSVSMQGNLISMSVNTVKTESNALPINGHLLKYAGNQLPIAVNPVKIPAKPKRLPVAGNLRKIAPKQLPISNTPVKIEPNVLSGSLLKITTNPLSIITNPMLLTPKQEPISPNSNAQTISPVTPMCVNKKPNVELTCQSLIDRGFKIVKLGPNAKIVKMNKVASPTNSPISSPESTVIQDANVKKPFFIKLPIKTTTTIGNSTIAMQVKSNALVNEAKPSTTVIEFKTNLNELINTKPISDIRKFTLSKHNINYLETLPKQKEMILKIRDQVKQVEAVCDSTSLVDISPKTIMTPSVVVVSEDSIQEHGVVPFLLNDKTQNDVKSIKVEQLQPAEEIETEIKSVTKQINELSEDDNKKSPGTDPNDVYLHSPLLKPFYVSITPPSDPEVLIARRTFPNYRFPYICPKCTRQYEQKHAFRGHLIGIHQMSQDDFSTLKVEVRPLIITAALCKRRKSNALDKAKKAIEAAVESKMPPDVIVSEENPNKDVKLVPVLKEDPIKYGYSRSKAVSEGKFKCDKCGRTCSSKMMLADHKSAKCSRDPQYGCKVCPKKFFSASTLSCHMTIHTGELPHQCNYCEKRFRTRGQRTVHHRTHTGERPFVCQVCTQGFTHRETLISHLARHIGMKRYKCYGCNKQFSCISGLKTHRETRPDTCGKVKLNSRAVGPRVRVINGTVLFEPQPEINPYLRTSDPQEVLSEIQNQQKGAEQLNQTN